MSRPGILLLLAALAAAVLLPAGCAPLPWRAAALAGSSPSSTSPSRLLSGPGALAAARDRGEAVAAPSAAAAQEAPARCPERPRQRSLRLDGWVDRFEGDWAVLLQGQGSPAPVPRCWLASWTREGDYVSDGEPDVARTLQARLAAVRRAEKLRRQSKRVFRETSP